MNAPTQRQREILRLIAERIDEGLPPTVRELGDALGISSTNGVADHLAALVRKGLLERRHNRARAMRLTTYGLQTIGRVA